jgi:cytidine deaminase
MEYKELFEQAVTARVRAYAPYSRFAVGAALLCADGSVYTGSNIENAAFTPTVCAERVAFFKAVSDGKRNFIAIAIAGGKAGRAPDPGVSPCGVCRQVMAEVCGNAPFDIVVGSGADDMRVYKLGELLPLGFGPDSLV